MTDEQRSYIPHLGWLNFEADDEVAELLYQGHFEAEEQIFVRCYLRPGDNFIDAGAHVGLYTLIASKIIGEAGRVVAFEPDSQTTRLLEKNLQEHHTSNTQILGLGLWSTDSELPFQRRQQGKSSQNSIHADGVDRVKVLALQNVPEVAETACQWNLVKIDCEGAEVEILQGAKELLLNDRIDTLLIEFNEHNLQRLGSSTQRLYEIILSFGFKLFRFDAETRSLIEADVRSPIWYQNLVACKNPFAVEKRLKSAPSCLEQITSDILLRANACARLKELEDLETYKAEAKQAKANKAWAKKTELSLYQQKELVQYYAEQIQQKELNCKQLSAQNKEIEQWAKHSEESLLQQKELVQYYAEQIQQKELNCKQLSAQNKELEQWAKHSEESLLQQKELVQYYAELIQQKELNCKQLSAQNKELEQWAKNSEESLLQQKELVQYYIKCHGIASENLTTSAFPYRLNIPEGTHSNWLKRAKDGPLLSVVICTHNPDLTILGKTFESLRRQSLPPALWELILVDNASTNEVINHGFPYKNGYPSLKIISEPKIGLTQARIRGFKEAKATWLALIDDDNYLEPDYLESALKIIDDTSNIGAFGGISEPDFETKPKLYLKEATRHLAIRNWGDQPITDNKDEWGKWEPIGAGMILRREVADYFINELKQKAGELTLGRIGQVLLGGEDSLLARCAYRLGYDCSYQPSLRLQHHIAARRVTFRYLCRLSMGQGRTYVALNTFLGKAVDDEWVATSPTKLAKSLYKNIQLKGRIGIIEWFWELGFYKQRRALTSSPSSSLS